MFRSSRRGRAEHTTAGIESSSGLESLVSIYRRPESYYLVTGARTTSGAWIDLPDPAITPVIDSSEFALGTAILDLLAVPATVVPHPKKDEWTARQDASLAAVRRAGTQSWGAFAAAAELVSVRRSADRITITPTRRATKPAGAYEHDTGRAIVLNSPTAHQVGQAVFEAFANL